MPLRHCLAILVFFNKPNRSSCHKACQIKKPMLQNQCLEIGMAIGPRPDRYPQKISAMGRVKPRFHRYGHEFG